MSEPTPSPERLTALLADASGGNVDALNRLFPLVYGELRQLASRRLRSERDGHTLETTALVHEAYLKLVDQTRVEWQGRAHFYAIASQAMRRILINYAEMRSAQKRGGSAPHVSLDLARGVVSDDDLAEVLVLDDALERLASFNPRGAEVVGYRFFGGLQWSEIAEVMGISEPTVRRAWTAARAWLRNEVESA